MLFRSVLVATLGATGVLSQTSTSCNPLEKSCPSDMALGQYGEFDFTKSEANAAVWNSTSTPIAFGDGGAQFQVAASGDGPNMNTNFYIFFGTVSVVMKAAPGSGICSSIVLLSDDLDEVDWEILGGNKTMVESNYFGKGNTTTYDRAIYHHVDFAPQDDYHNYTFHWTADKLDWIIDGKTIRTLNYGDALGGKNYPQTPMKTYLGAWAAGDPKNAKGIIEWAQGTTDFKQGPWSMYIKHVYIQDQSTGSTYTYSDKSGTWQSIKAASGPSLIVPELNRVSGPKAHWNKLAPGVRVGIIAGSIAGLVAVIGAVMWCCIRSTRKGLREHAKAEADWEAQRKEAAQWQAKFNEDRTMSISSTAKSYEL